MDKRLRLRTHGMYAVILTLRPSRITTKKDSEERHTTQGVERIKDQDMDGVSAEVLYTTFGMPLFRLPDADLQRACFKVYNDWVA